MVSEFSFWREYHVENIPPLAVDQLNKIFDVLGICSPSSLSFLPHRHCFVGTPNEYVIKRISSEKVCPRNKIIGLLISLLQAQAYVRSLPKKRKVAFEKLIPNADPQGK
jgi:hypothetical protein